MAESSERELTADELAYIAAARDKAFVLYEGVRTPHRSCGIALAETFGLPTPAHQALRRAAITWYQSAWRTRLVPDQPDIVCNHLVRPHGDFAGPARKAFCTNLAAEVAALTAEALCRFAPRRPALATLTIGQP